MNQTTPNAIENLELAQQRAMSVRPKVGGFPVLAEILRQAGIRKNTWYLPAAESLYETDYGPVVNQGSPLATGLMNVPRFSRDEVVQSVRADQNGESTFPEFLLAIWQAGVVRYEVDFDERVVTYYGFHGDSYVEAYPAVEV